MSPREERLFSELCIYAEWRQRCLDLALFRMRAADRRLGREDVDRACVLLEAADRARRVAALYRQRVGEAWRELRALRVCQTHSGRPS